VTPTVTKFPKLPKLILFVKNMYLTCKLEKIALKKSFYKTYEHSSFTGAPACGSRAGNLTGVLIGIKFYQTHVLIYLLLKNRA
jgi:hypothetical protein